MPFPITGKVSCQEQFFAIFLTFACESTHLRMTLVQNVKQSFKKINPHCCTAQICWEVYSTDTTYWFYTLYTVQCYVSLEKSIPRGSWLALHHSYWVYLYSTMCLWRNPVREVRIIVARNASFLLGLFIQHNVSIVTCMLVY
jgi:hypothetical protein